ncbi:MAG: VWA domain-containing protein [Treponema sp.]|nr:VWA domain-containing protein [Treponema sp.]
MKFGFDSPPIVAAAFILIPLAAFILSRLKNPFVASIPLGAPGGVPFKAHQTAFLVKLLKALELAGVFLLFFSAASPVIKTVETVWLNRGADIIFILDVSPSMAAQDMEGNRFNSAKKLILEFTARRPSDNIGLVAVGEDAALLVPPTSDREALNLRLEQLRIGEFGDGTALGMGLAVAAFHLEKSNARRKAAVLITDGENNAGAVHPETAADLLREMGVSFWVIAAGSAGEVPIDYVDPYTRIRRTGIFDSRYDPESLRRLSAAGGGTFIAAPSSEALTAAFSRLDEAEMTVQRVRDVNMKRSLSFQFLIFAVLILTSVRFIRGILSGWYKYGDKFAKEMRKKLLLSAFFFCVFAAFSFFALAGQRRETGFGVSDYRRGLDVVFAVDVSRSMDIRDAQTNETPKSRLERGLLIAAESTRTVTGARFAAAAGRGRGYLTVPLTFDIEASLNFLEALDLSSVTGRSTNLESLIEAAGDAFQSSSPARKVIVLISDGESHFGVLRNALNRCAKEGIIVNAVAVGSDEGKPVPEDDNGQPPAVSRREAVVMRMAAERTGGIYIDGGRTDASSVLSAHLLSLAQETSGNSSIPKDKRTLLVILAIIAYGASKFISLMPSARRFSFVSIIAVVFVFSSCSQGKLLLLKANYLFSLGRYDEAVVPYLEALNYEEAAPYAEYGLGLTFYFIDEEEAALNRYGNSQKILESLPDGEHRELRYRNYYNSGVIHFEQGDFPSAAAAFKEALKADPGRIDAKRNLEISLLSISAETTVGNRTESRSETKEILFEYIRQEEQQRWTSREWAPQERYEGPDY